MIASLLRCVQEEIRFLLSPELIVSRAFAESLEDHEALLLEGVERFSSYRGYARTFEYADPSGDDPSACKCSSRRPVPLPTGTPDRMKTIRPHRDPTSWPSTRRSTSAPR
jgi:hypothetical protein